MYCGMQTETLRRKLKVSKSKSLISFLLVIIITACLALISAYGLDVGPLSIPSVTSDNGIRLGLDLVGGSYITFEAEIPNGTSEEDRASGMDAVVENLRGRLDRLGFTEATVAKSGTNRVVVEIPDIQDPEEAVRTLGTTAELSFKMADGTVVMTGADIAKATAAYGKLTELGTEQHYIQLQLNKDAVSKFAEATKKAASLASEGNNYISIYLDENEISRPSVQEEINSDSCVIQGSFTADEARELAALITAGQLTFPLNQVELRSVGPTLGEESLKTSITAGVIGLIIIILFMIVFYRLPGLVAAIALIFYTVICLVALAVLRINLSLPGIAGIILSIGMAVDANVVIYERIKEELRAGKTIKASVESGFHRAFTAIIDSNITTIIAGVVLKIFGTGTIIGFADTLLIGVILSMFTAVVLSKFMLKALVGLNIKNPKLYGI
mgnify:CR=1 FL=1